MCDTIAVRDRGDAGCENVRLDAKAGHQGTARISEPSSGMGERTLSNLRWLTPLPTICVACAPHISKARALRATPARPSDSRAVDGHTTYISGLCPAGPVLPAGNRVVEQLAWGHAEGATQPLEGVSPNEAETPIWPGEAIDRVQA